MSTPLGTQAENVVGATPPLSDVSIARPSLFPELASHAFPPGETFASLLKRHGDTRLLVKNQEDRVEALIFEFARRGVAHQVFRWTGWAGAIKDYAPKLKDVADAFTGVKGFHLFGGTQIRDLNSGEVIPTSMDLPVVLKHRDQDLILIGIIPKVEEEPKLISEIGLILRVNEQFNQFTCVHPDQNMGIILQPDVNGTYTWKDEIIESRRLSLRLAEKQWSTNLVVFGGSPTEAGAKSLRNVEQELVWWAEDAKRNPDKKINIFLIKGSGGVADKYAADKEWLAENPSVKVLEMNAHSIHSTLDSLGIISDWKN